jgi:2-amino-4-hydroxy-6-hydroxymethyldihydropteridine diphosphokinase
MPALSSDPATVAFVGLGSNLGDSAAVLRAALRALDALPRTRLSRASKLYRTPAWGQTDQPDFLNAVAMLDTALTARELLAAMLEIEREAGRSRRADGSDRWGPRTLDLDLLLYAEAVIAEPGLHVPHPHLHERAFALVPLVEIAPDARIPGIGLARQALAGIDAGQIQAIGSDDRFER